jgi:hypothetical protein
MQDIDFDELDRAVSSLISATPDTDSDKAALAASPVSVNASPAPAAEPAPYIAPVVPQEPVVPVVAPMPAVPAAANLVQNRPNLGRSMDFIRPNTPTPTMQRTNNTDPIVAPITTPPVINNPDAITPSAPIGGSVVEKTPEAPEPSESPFITDAKVEKRPLGAFSEGKVPEGESAEVNSPTYAAAIALENSIVEGKDENPSISVDTPLPAELQNNLLQIESSDATSGSMTMPIQPAEEPKVEIKSADMSITEAIDSSKHEAEEKVAVPTEPAANPNVVNSISQQYPTSAVPAPQNTGPIFDTSVYHNSANIKPVKKSNAWIWILMIVLILIGATIGVGIYLFVK